MSVMTSQITGVSMVCWTICSGAEQRKHHSSASLAFLGAIQQGPVNSPHKRPVTWKIFPFDDVTMDHWCYRNNQRRKKMNNRCGMEAQLFKQFFHSVWLTCSNVGIFVSRLMYTPVQKWWDFFSNMIKLILTLYVSSWKIASTNTKCFAIYMPDFIKFRDRVTAQWLPKVGDA